MAAGLTCYTGAHKLDRLPERFSRTSITPSYRSPSSYSLSMAKQSPSGDSHGGSHSNRPRLPSISNLLSATSQSPHPFQQVEAGSTTLSSPPASLRTTLSPDKDARLTSPPQLPPLQLPPDRANIQGRGDATQFTSTNEVKSELLEPYVGNRGVLFNPPNPFAPPSPQSQPFAPTTSPETAPSRKVIRQAHVPGKGLCFIYDDGTNCQTTVNGDPVNPKWGTTKAGKPRKRLGQACNACREKKIKCDPGIPRCTQCQKSNRDCRFETTYVPPRLPSMDHPLMSSSSRTPYGSQATPSARESPSAADMSRDQYFERKESNASVDMQPDQVFTRTDSRSSMNVENLLSPSFTDNTEHTDTAEYERPAKKARFTVASSTGSASRPSDRQSEGESPIAEDSMPKRSGSRFGISADPYAIDEKLTLHYLGHFFTRTNWAAYAIFPQKVFMQWVREDQDKSYQDHMLLYAMMALGSVFAGGDTTNHRAVFVGIADEAAADGPDTITLHLVQTRLILSITAYSSNDVQKSWDLCGLAIRSAFDMHLNVEADGDKSIELNKSYLGLDAASHAECRRRTFWAAYIMDCFHGYSSEYISSINKSDCNLRLPCPENKYEEGTVAEMPMFDKGVFGVDRKRYPGFLPLGITAFLVQIATIYSNIIDHIRQSHSIPAAEYDQVMEAFTQETLHNMHSWDEALKKQFFADSLESKSESRDTARDDTASEEESGFHVIYHYSAMTLYRFVRFEHMNASSIQRNCNRAYGHARKLLELIHKMHEPSQKSVAAQPITTSCPVTVHAIVAAIDVITAAGTWSNVLEHETQNHSTMMALIYSGIEELEKLMEQWHTAKHQLEHVQKRVRSILTTSESGASSRKMAFFFREPLHGFLDRTQDIVYGLPRLDYLNALGRETLQEGDIYEIGS